MERLTDALYEAKLVYHTKAFGDTVRTFCMNPYGEVTTESYGDVVTVNGHSYAEAKTPYTNFAVLVSQRFTEPFRDPIAYGRSIAKLANLLGDGILVQRLADLKAGRRSTPERIAQSLAEPTLAHATPGDLAAVLPVPPSDRHHRVPRRDGSPGAGHRGSDRRCCTASRSSSTRRGSRCQPRWRRPSPVSTPSATAPASRAVWCSPARVA